MLEIRQRTVLNIYDIALANETAEISRVAYRINQVPDAPLVDWSIIRVSEDEKFLLHEAE